MFTSAGTDWPRLMAVLCVSWLARFLFVWLMPPEAISYDIYSWQAVAMALRDGLNPYKVSSFLNWPPFWMQLIHLIDRISVMLGISFVHGLQLFLAAVESAVICLTFRLISRLGRGPAWPLALVGLALNPACILLTCQHGNFDVLVGLWVLLFVGSLIQYQRSKDEVDWLLACLFLGLGILTKTVPLVLCPLLAGGWRRSSWPARAVGLALVLGPVCLGMSIIYVLAPQDITAKVLGYRSLSGWFGISGLLHLSGLGGLTGLSAMVFYALLFVAAVFVALAFYRNREIEPPTILLAAALLLASIPILGPGYGPQYLYWYLPLLIVSYRLCGPVWRRTLLVSGIIAAITYLVEYGILLSHGCYFFQILEHLKHRLSDQSAAHLRWWISQTGQIVQRLPLFLMLLTILAIGGRIVVRNLKSGREQTNPPSSGGSG